MRESDWLTNQAQPKESKTFLMQRGQKDSADFLIGKPISL